MHLDLQRQKLFCQVPPGINFINMLTHSCYALSSQKCKKLLDLSVLFALLESADMKAACKMLIKLPPDDKFQLKVLRIIIFLFYTSHNKMMPIYYKTVIAI